MPRALLVACGNTLRGDDGVGWWVGAEIEQSPPIAGLEVVLTHQLLPELAEQVSSAEIVGFVDCSTASEPGVVSLTWVKPAPSLPRLLTHHLDPASLLRTAFDYFGRIPQLAFAVTVGGGSMGLAEGLSDLVQAAIPAAVGAVEDAFVTYALQTTGDTVPLRT